MRVAQVLGDVTLSKWLAPFDGKRFLIVQPLGQESLPARGETEPRHGAASPSESVVALDELSPGRGATVAISEGREAAMPFHPQPVPIDVYCAAVLDDVVCKVTGAK